MKAMAELKQGLSEGWRSLAEGWEHIREHAGAAMTRFRRDRRPRTLPAASDENFPLFAMLTIAMRASLGRLDELAAHIRATRNTGVTQDEVKEVLLQVAVYAGAPAANSAFAVAKKTYKEMASEGKK